MEGEKMNLKESIEQAKKKSSNLKHNHRGLLYETQGLSNSKFTLRNGKTYVVFKGNVRELTPSLQRILDAKEADRLSKLEANNEQKNLS